MLSGFCYHLKHLELKPRNKLKGVANVTNHTDSLKLSPVFIASIHIRTGKAN